MLTIIFFLGTGLIIGSFLNAVAWRLREGMGLGGRSMCPSCRAPIAWYDNIPLLSFVVLGGKCRSCRADISWRYPIVEASTGAVFVALGVTFFSPWLVESWLLTTFFLVAFAVLILIFIHDLSTMEIPDILLWIGVGWSLFMLLVIDAYRVHLPSSVWDLSVYSGLVGAFVGFIPLFLISTLSREKWMGMGDGFLMFFIGLVVGWPGILLAIVIGFGIGAVVGVTLIALRRKDMHSQIPLGPFLVAGALLALLLPEWFPSIDHFFLSLDVTLFV